MAGILIRCNFSAGRSGLATINQDANDDVIANMPGLKYWLSGQRGISGGVAKEIASNAEFTKGASTKTFPALANPATFGNKQVFDFSAATTACLAPSGSDEKVSPGSYTIMFLVEWTNSMSGVARAILQTRVGLSSGNFGVVVQKASTANLEFYPNFAASSGQKVSISHSFTTGAPQLHAITYDAATKAMAIYVNDMTVPAGSGTSSAANVGDDRYLIFGNVSASVAPMYMADALYFDRVLTSAQMVAIKAALDDKYGL